MLKREEILSSAAKIGFSLCAVTRCRPLVENRRRFSEWLEAGYDSDLEYLRRNFDKRFDPSLLLEGARSIVVCAVNYRNEVSGGYGNADRGKIASYACAGDYHSILKNMLFELLGRLRESEPGLVGRPFVDSAPLLEKQWAVEAGLGWIGRNSLLVTPQYGSFVVLGELVLCDEADEYDTPYVGDGCGGCRRCIEACPNGAIVRERVIDTGRCISRLTIERERSGELQGEVPDGLQTEKTSGLHGWIFGCDACQNVCPYNSGKPLFSLPAFAPLFDPRDMTAEEWRAMNEEEFDRRFGRTPLKRSGLKRIVRNLDR